MLNKKEIEEIKEHLRKAQNPIFYYDNDADGLCTFLILRRFIGRGYGVAARSYPELNEDYARKARELKADYVFILDKPVVSIKFFEKIKEMNLPVVWLDHHDVSGKSFREEIEKFENLEIYNPALKSGKEKSSEPTSYLAYRISEKKDDLWISMAGCIADHFIPDFADEFAQKYPDLWGKAEKPFDFYYKTEIGKIAFAFNFGLKDSITNVVKMQNFLIKIKSPSEVLVEGANNADFLKRVSEIQKKYDALIGKALDDIGEKSIFFEYSGELSISSDIANELVYRYPKKYIVVAYRKAGVTNISMRGENVKELLRKILGQMENATGGGHKDAVGARIKTDDLKRFKELFEQEIKA